ncbi:MAG: DegT/DnrJ/EryC1/StrS aminotransferase family protein [Gammaproteobacteria bacterium]|nr:MAG: DegT/DnrJ/EryC1/StrS aminotransferase family protein [Gammaproteobacteria bacterium]
MDTGFLPFTRPDIEPSTIEGVAEVLRSGWLASGPWVERFEQALSDYLGGRPVRVVTSGTAALELALAVAGIGPGDEVLVPAMTFAATANVVVRAGARPVFVDVDPVSRNLLVEDAERAITPRTRAIMPVHFSGLPADMAAIRTLARQHHLRIIEDAAHAIGSRIEGRPVGSTDDLACFSFHPNKNMTSIEGGAIVLNDADEAERVERLRFHGIRRTPEGMIDIVEAGGKYNLPDVNARIGHDQLGRLDAFNTKRRRLAGHYFSILERLALPVTLPARGDEGHSWHMFQLLIDFDALRLTRPGFIAAMRERGIGIGVHYPALHETTLYRGYNPRPCPNASRVGRETVTLPLFPAMETTDVERVCTALSEVLRGS